MFEKLSKNGLDENLKKWQKSDQFTKYIEQEATSKGISISMPITEEKMRTLSNDATILSTTTTKTLNVPLYGQETSYYCGPASAQMTSAYYGVSKTQTTLFNLMGGNPTTGVTINAMLNYYKLSRSSGGLGKTNSYSASSGLTFNKAVTEIDNSRPFTSRIYYAVTGNGHLRVCKGYQYNIYGLQYIILNNPLPVGQGSVNLEGIGLETHRIYVM